MGIPLANFTQLTIRTNPWDIFAHHHHHHQLCSSYRDFFSFRSFLLFSRVMSVAHQILIISILTCFFTSSFHLVRGLPSYLNPSGCMYVSLLGMQISSMLAAWPADRSLAILITAEKMDHWSLSAVKPHIIYSIFLSNTSAVFFFFSFFRHDIQNSATYNFCSGGQKKSATSFGIQCLTSVFTRVRH